MQSETEHRTVVTEPCWNCGNPIWHVGGDCLCCGFYAELWPERLAEERAVAKGVEPVNRGRLFKLRLERSAAARADALASIRERPDRRWQARVGGMVRGRTEVFRSRQEAARAVKEHYDAALLAFVRRGR